MKLYIATSTPTDQVHAQYALSLANTCAALATEKIKFKIEILPAEDIAVQSRNLLIDRFWSSDCDYMLLINHELGWEAQAVIRMLRLDCEAVAGVYPSKHTKQYQFVPQFEDNGDIRFDGVKALIYAEFLLCGFMMLSRSAIAKMRDTHKDCVYINANNHSAYNFFSTTVTNQKFMSDDSMFCNRLKQAGIQIFVDPTIGFVNGTARGQLTDVLEIG